MDIIQRGIELVYGTGLVIFGQGTLHRQEHRVEIVQRAGDVVFQRIYGAAELAHQVWGYIGTDGISALVCFAGYLVADGYLLAAYEIGRVDRSEAAIVEGEAIVYDQLYYHSAGGGVKVLSIDRADAVTIDRHGVRFVDAVYILKDRVVLAFGSEKVDTLEEIEPKNENDDSNKGKQAYLCLIVHYRYFNQKY